MNSCNKKLKMCLQPPFFLMKTLANNIGRWRFDWKSMTNRCACDTHKLSFISSLIWTYIILFG
jgi:hypothetical protein